MFIFNFKINGNKTAKILLGVLCIVILILTVYISYKVIFNNAFQTNDGKIINNNKIYELNTKNYTNVLQNVHNNIDTYAGQKVKFIGYVYRLYDFSDEQFVLARNMVVSSDFQTVVVGFLCHSKIAQNFADGAWVEIEGTITKGDYYGEIPVIEIEQINQVNAPTDEYVYPPDNSFVTTSTIL